MGDYSHVQMLRALEILESKLDKAETDVVDEAVKLIGKNELTPELALQKWYEIAGLRRAPERLKREIRKAGRQNLAHE